MVAVSVLGHNKERHVNSWPRLVPCLCLCRDHCCSVPLCRDCFCVSVLCMCVCECVVRVCSCVVHVCACVSLCLSAFVKPLLRQALKHSCVCVCVCFCRTLLQPGFSSVCACVCASSVCLCWCLQRVMLLLRGKKLATPLIHRRHRHRCRLWLACHIEGGEGAWHTPLALLAATNESLWLGGGG